MRKRIKWGTTVLAIAVLVAACGSSSNDTLSKFKSDYEAQRGSLDKTGTAIGQEIQQASKQTDAQVGAAFHTLATRFQSQLSQLETLKPPANLAADWNTLTAAATRLEADLNAVVAAAATHSQTAAEQAGASLVTDAAALKAAAAPIKSKLGIK